MCRQHDDDRPTAWRRHDEDMTTRTRRCDDGATTVISPGSASNPSLWHVISLGSGPNPGLWRSSLRRRTVVSSSSCRRHVVAMPSSCRQSIVVVPWAHRRRAAELSPLGRRHIVVVPSSPSSYGPVVISHIPIPVGGPWLKTIARRPGDPWFSPNDKGEEPLHLYINKWANALVPPTPPLRGG